MSHMRSRIRRGRWTFSKGLLCLTTLLSLTGALHAETSVFISGLSLPQGIAADSAGNIYVHSDAVSTTHVTKFTPQGTPVARVSLGGINASEFVGSRLTRIPGTDRILLLSPQGIILYFNRELQGEVLYDLRPLAGQVAHDVFDVLTQNFRRLVLGVPQYGDIAARWTEGNLLEVLVSATTGAAGGFPLIVRIRFDLQNRVAEPKVVLTSQGTTAGSVNIAPGLAVNAEGAALTTLPFPTDLGFADGLVSFRTDFPENRSQLPRFILRDFASFGMTVDELGNFYIASGVVGSSHCGIAASGALVFIDRQTIQPICLPIALPLGRSADVAVSPIDNSVYMTMSELNGGVLRFDPIVSVGQ